MAHLLKALGRLALAALLATAPLAAIAQPPKPAYVTGSITTGAIAKASGPQSVTTGDLSGDCTTSSSLAVICLKTNGVAFAASATTDTTNAGNIGSGTLGCSRLPAFTGDVTNSACVLTIGAHKVVLGDIAQIGANTVLGNATGSTADVAAQSMPSCSATTSALTWTTSSGFGCHTISASGAGISGTPTAGNCASWANSTTLQDAGAACGGGGGGSGAMTLVSTQTVSAVSSVVFTGFASGYDYVILGENVGNSASSNVYLQVGTGAGPTYDTGNNYNWWISAPLDGVSTHAGPTSKIYFYAGGATNTSQSMKLEVNAPSLSGQHYFNGYYSRGGGLWGGAHFATAVITAIKFVADSGTITGTFSLYSIAR